MRPGVTHPVGDEHVSSHSPPNRRLHTQRLLSRAGVWLSLLRDGSPLSEQCLGLIVRTLH